jgi:hypothetical protein
MVKFTVPVLFAFEGSAVLAEIVALLLEDNPPTGTTVLSGAVAVIVMLLVAPTGMVARVHVTVLPVTPHVQLVPLAEIPENPDGNVSVTVTDEAASGPDVLRGDSVNVVAPAAITGEGDTDLVIDRSAPEITLTLAVVVLLFKIPSGVVADNVAELVMVPLIELFTLVTMLSTLLAPLASEPLRLQVTVLPAAEQLQLVPDAET